MLNKFPAPGSWKFFDLIPISHALSKAFAKSIFFQCMLQVFSVLLSIFFFASPSFANVKFINTNSTDNLIAMRGDDELILPFSTDKESFVLILLKEHYISARLYLETDTGKILRESKIRDLYLQRRLLVTDVQCQKCRIRITGWTEHPEESKIQLSINRYSYKKNQIRFEAEQKMRDAAFLEEGSYEKSKLFSPEFHNFSLNQTYENHCRESYRDIKLKIPLYFKDCFNYQPSAFDFYKMAVADWTEISEKVELTNALFLAGNISDDATSVDSRKNYFERAKVLALNNNDIFAFSRLEAELGRIEFEYGDYEKAERIYKTILGKINSIKNSDINFSKGNILHQIGQIWLLKENKDKAKSNDYQKAAAYFDGAYKEFSSISDASSMADILNTKGYLNRLSNKFDLAASQHQVAYTLSKIPSDAIRLEMRTLHYMSRLSATRGRFFYALQLESNAEEEAMRLNSLYDLSYIRTNRAKINLDLGRYKESAELYLQVEPDLKAVGLDDDLKMVYTNLGLSYAMLGDFNLSSFYFDKAKNELKGSATSEGENNLKRAEVEALMKQKKYQEALLQQKEIIDEQDNTDKFISGRNLSVLSEAYFHLADLKNAFSAAQNALALHKQVNDDLYFTKSSYLAANSLFKLNGNISDILKFIDAAIIKIENIRLTLAQDNLRREYFSLQRSLYELKVEVNLVQYDRGALSATEVLANVEMFKARTLYESMIKSSEQKNFNTTSSMTIRHSESGLAIGAGEGQFDSVTTEHFLTEMFSYFSKPIEFSAEQLVQPLNAQSIQRYLKTLSGDQAILYYFTGKNIALAWLLSRDNIKMYKLPASEILDSQIDVVANNISVLPRDINEQKLLQQHVDVKNLSDLLLGEIGGKLKKFTRLTIIPDGTLQRIPFSLLMDVESSEPLLATHSLTYGMSLTTVDHLQHKSNHHYKTGSILLVANPQYTISNSSQITNVKKFKSLPYSVFEVESIANIWAPKNEVELLTGKRASKKMLNEKNPENFEVLHFASHALINWEYPELTSIALTVDDSSSEQSPYLTVSDITQWSLSTELVVLSACETAMGKQIQGEGSMGLSRAFFDAGAKRVVASLWPIEDEASAFLMKAFYAALMDKNVTPPQALQTAQREVSKDERWNNPYYWASMVYFGNQEAWRE